jgi:hypothetical protein
MNTESLFKPVQNIGELEASCLQQLEASMQIGEIAENVNGMIKHLEEKAVAFYNNLVTAHLDLQLSSALSAYASTQAEAYSKQNEHKIENLPLQIKKIIESSGERAGKAQLELTLFFQYLTKDNSYCTGMGEKVYDEKIGKFMAAIERLRSYFKRKASAESPHLTKDSYQMNLNTRDIAYKQSWDMMLMDLTNRYEVELERPDKTRDDQRIKELRRTIYDCKQIKRFEKQEKIDLSKLAKMGSTLYETIGLE